MPILTCSVMFLLVLWQSSEANKSDSCSSLHILGNQSVDSKSIKIRFCRAPVSKWQVTGSIKLFLAPSKMCTKYADYSVAAMIEVWFVYLSRENIASVFSKFFSCALLIVFDLAKCTLWPPFAVKNIGPLFQGPYMLSLSPIGDKYFHCLY